MLCHELKHFYTRNGALSNDFQTAIERCISQLIDIILPDGDVNLGLEAQSRANSPSDKEKTPEIPPEPDTHSDMPSDPMDNGSTPCSNWDGLLAAERLLRKSGPGGLTDLTTPSGRDRMANFIRNADYLDAHDAHSTAKALDNYVKKNAGKGSNGEETG